MAQFSKIRTAGGRFVLLMALILIFLILLVLSIRKHAADRPNNGPPPNQHLQH
ncbi:MAG TPA: hypothetical protein VFY05_08595 [Candidatus Angelobacter sp.]|nr:hypothetical protein [Candidatus Angelobacter sp.]